MLLGGNTEKAVFERVPRLRRPGMKVYPQEEGLWRPRYWKVESVQARQNRLMHL